MNTCRAMRNVSVGGLGRGRSLVCHGSQRRSIWGAPRGGNRLMRLSREAFGEKWDVNQVGRAISGRRSLHFASGGRMVIGSSVVELRYTASTHFNTYPPTTLRYSSSTTTPTNDSKPSPALPEQLRSTMRLLAHSVVVCTSTHDQSPRGMTMSSFTSLTLTPTPLITFNVATPSRTLDAIRSSQHFNIHILAGTTDGAAVANHFTRGNASDHVFDGLDGVTCEFGNMGGEGYGRTGAPVVRGEGVLRVLRCKVVGDAPEGGLVRVRDHVVVVGEVMEVMEGGGGDEFGLAYADRQYRQVGDVISKDG